MENSDYYLGLDCGTDSTGYAVTDCEYNILKFNGKAMWGSHVFDAAETASSRRANRCARRRLERRKQRIALLQEIFAEEIHKIDPVFFIRLNDSKYQIDDKRIDSASILFNDADYKDKDFFREYPTIYHLRKALMTEDIADPRMLYLAIAHILKHRGHFLFPGDNFSSVLDLKPVLENISDAFVTVFEENISYDVNAVEIALQKKTSSEKKEELEKCISTSSQKLTKLIHKAILGYKVRTEDLIANEAYTELPAIEFRKQSFEEADLPKLKDALNDDEYSLVFNLKALYDWSLLALIIAKDGVLEPYISNAKVRQYEHNGDQLRMLKNAIRKHCPDKYEWFFHSPEGSFSSYIGKNHDDRKGSVRRIKKRINSEEFNKSVKSLLKDAPKDDVEVQSILSAIENDEFMPLLSSYRNSVIPYQMNKIELEAILRNAVRCFPFLLDKDADGFSNEEKIMSLLTFRIPYYVGPLGRNTEYTGKNQPWMIRREKGRITPWNFSLKVNEEESAELFIQRMTSKCTYCAGEDVLPRQSIAYSRYLVLDELNNLRIKGSRLEVDRKQEIFNKLYKEKKRVTKKDIIGFAVNSGWWHRNEISVADVSGIEEDLKASFSSYIDFKDLIESKTLAVSDADRIIKWITIFPEGGRILRTRIEKEYGSRLSEKEIKRICSLKYEGWGRFSYKYLYGLTSFIPELNEEKSIVSAMWETQSNRMELMSRKYEFADHAGMPESIGKLDYSVVDDMYASPAVKKQIWQTLRIVDEIERIMKHPPKKVFVEVTRQEGMKGQRTVSRKNDLISKLKEAEKAGLDFSIDVRKLIDELGGKEERDISRQDKLYLYFSQCGRCMYSGKPIELSDLYNTNIYDIDHIYPFSVSNDDSLSNRVLVLKKENAKKTNDYPISDSVRSKMAPFWDMLRSRNLISKEKYDRLVRRTPLNQEDTEGFINRQIVETSQTAKATIEILKSYFGKETKIVYSKARNVSEFRQMFGFVKCRTLNNLHHAKDAYLNVVVGNILDVKYSSEFFSGVNGKGYYNLSKPFEYPVKNAWNIERRRKTASDGLPLYDRNGNEIYEIAGPDIDIVSKTMNRNNIQYTIQQTTNEGQLYDLQIVRKGSKNGALPVKPSDSRLVEMISNGMPQDEAYSIWTSTYGGYNSLKVSYFSLISHINKKKEYVSFVPISIVDKALCSTDEGLLKYCTEILHLEKPSIIRHRILKNTEMIIDGYPLAISGKSSGGADITLSNCVPLILSVESQRILKKIENVQKKQADDKTYVIDEIHDGIDDSALLSIFTELVSKHDSEIYMKRPGRQDSILNMASMERFLALSLAEKVSLIGEIMRYYSMNNGSANLLLLGGSKRCGVLTKGSRLQKGKSSLVLVDKSITGLFETRTKVL